ncbi:TrkH family potassium uptake protein [Oceanobacillus alkalisoli]|uniref:TrkH family potassium uptake protein n=1 Tax=Oceanobacillus alkalisoli TaxID=2925113 RepID=UPI001EEFAECA|nr:TrkH family potassium uptake protein [Oceanobacillus alkalisoli]MCF3944754.1 TrkH family potassium uptake protein [Oceanobacillus alkalisoli]MCG5104358.1 TrkH family potassium uptake protein [Oceanobacillus alkalisoli]
MNIRDGKLIWLNRLTPVQLLLLFYIVAVIFSTVLLALPVAYKENASISFIDLLFTAVSALSVTGLSTISIVDTFSTTGVILLTIILHLGAVGVMAISTLIWLIIGKKIGLIERRLIMTDQNQTSFKGMVRLIKQIIILILFVELLFVIILGFYYLTYYDSVAEAFFHGYFTTITAISNAGFDLTGLSMIPFRGDYFIQGAVMFLIIFGAVGFPVLIECKEFLLGKRKKNRTYRFTLFFKVTVATFFALILIGAIGIYLLDINGFFKGVVWHESFFYAVFQSVTTRSGGLATLDVSKLTDANQLFMSFLMFVGASPSSAGGGIRTTTFALVMLFILTYISGKKQVRIFNREIHEEDLRKAVTITLVALFIMFASVLLVSVVEDFSLTQILFEVTSAFGTVGLSMGITADLSILSKILLMLLMFIGRVGIITFLLIFRPRVNPSNVRYPKERMIIG